MDLIAQYEQAMQSEDWPRALMAIRAIVERGPQISTSWFNLGVVLDALERHAEAADAFSQAYALAPEDFGAQYRMFRSLFLSGDRQQLLARVQAEAEHYPEIVDLIAEDDLLGSITQDPAFVALRKNFQAPPN